jgi:hypothetical protein
MMSEPGMGDGFNDPGGNAPFIVEWPDDGVVHRIQLVLEVPSGPGVEIVAAELLLDWVQRFNYQGLVPALVALRITTPSRPGR